MALPLAAIGVGAQALGAIGGLFGGAKRQRSADRLNNEAVRMAREDDKRRAPLREGANRHLLAPLGVNPAAGQGPGTRFGTHAGMADNAAGRVAGFGGIGDFEGVGPGQASNFDPSRRFIGAATGEVGGANLAPVSGYADRARQLTAGQLEQVGSAPSRQDIAMERFQGLLDETEDVRTQGVRSIGQSAAKFGRLGSGMVTTDLGNLEDRLQTNLMREARGLSADTAAQEESDRINRLGITSGVAGQFRGEDLAYGSTDANLALQRGSAYQGLGRDVTDLADREFGQGFTLRGEARGERDAATDHRLRALDADRGILDDLSRRESQSYGQGVNERDFTDRMYQSGLNNRLNFGSTLAGIGYQSPDIGALTSGAALQQQAGQTESKGALDAVGEFFRARAAQPGGTVNLGQAMQPLPAPRVAPVAPVSLAPIGRNPTRINR